MSNFEFVKTALPSLFEDCYRAEAYLGNDAPTACFYARRAIEGLVYYIYRVRNFYIPERANLITLLGEGEFSRLLDDDKRLKFHAIRKTGNDAAHGSRKISAADAHRCVEDLFHLYVWAVYNHSRAKTLAPLGSAFDVEKTPRARQEALSKERMAALEAERQAELNEQAEKYQAQLAAKDQKILKLNRLLEEAQAAHQLPDTHDYRESQTRDYFIDQLLHEAGWALDSPNDREYELTGLPTASGKGYADYVLWDSDGRPLGVVEAKRSRTSPDIGRDQAKLYADALEHKFGTRPVIFYTNGNEHRMWDDAAGYPPLNDHYFYSIPNI